MRAGRRITWFLAALALLALAVLRGVVGWGGSDDDTGVPAEPRGPVAAAPPAGSISGAAAPTRERAGPESASLASLAAALEAERAAREALAAEVAALREEFARVAQEAATSGGARVAPEPPAAPLPAPPQAAGFDEQALLAAGFAPRDARALRERVEEIELERLYLRDQATREGWLGTARFREAVRALSAREDALRDELGPEQYDWVLFASGRSNRVRVEGVLERSPAREAGLQPGDLIVSYAGGRLFTAEELRGATAEGRAGETVELEVLREGEPLRVFVPRGPLGVRLSETRLRPAG